MRVTAAIVAFMVAMVMAMARVRRCDVHVYLEALTDSDSSSGTTDSIDSTSSDSYSPSNTTHDTHDPINAIDAQNTDALQRVLAALADAHALFATQARVAVVPTRMYLIPPIVGSGSGSGNETGKGAALERMQELLDAFGLFTLNSPLSTSPLSTSPLSTSPLSTSPLSTSPLSTSQQSTSKQSTSQQTSPCAALLFTRSTHAPILGLARTSGACRPAPGHVALVTLARDDVTMSAVLAHELGQVFLCWL